MTKKKTDTEFKKEVYDLVGNEYTFLDDYQGSITKIRVKHNTCGNIYEVTPSNFLNKGRRCPMCYGNIKKTDKQFKQEVFELVGNEYTFLEPYVNNATKLRVKHNICENVYKVTPTDFFSKHSRCPYCFGTHKKTNEQFQQEVFDLVGDEYTFLDSYVNNKTKIRVKHNTCGNIYKVSPNSFFRGHRCSQCAKLIRYDKLAKTDTQFKQEVCNLVKGEYTFLDQYVNSKTKLRVKHNKCGNIYFVTPTDFFSKHSRCPYCNSPKGETIISKILNNLNINYEPQKTFEDLRDTAYLSYDFYVPDQNILIEYQGIQHYQAIEYFGGIDAFDKQRKHDIIKLQYAKNNNYNLIAVPYTEDTFSKIKKYLVKHGLKLSV